MEEDKVSVDLDETELLDLVHYLVRDSAPDRDRDGLYLFGSISNLRMFYRRESLDILLERSDLLEPTNGSSWPSYHVSDLDDDLDEYECIHPLALEGEVH